MDILLTNDDGIRAPGLRVLAEILSTGTPHRIAVIAPDAQCSATGMRVTLFRNLRARPVEIPGVYRAFSVDGTPVDCVKLGMRTLFNGHFPDDEFRPDIVISGINPGANVGVNALYSGTVAAALEANICDVPAIAISMDRDTPSTENQPDATRENRECDYEYAARFTIQLLDWIESENVLPRLGVLNCNIPHSPRSRVRGVRFCNQGTARFDEWHVLEDTHPDGSLEFSLDGRMRYDVTEPDDDAFYLRDGWIVLSVLGLHLTRDGTDRRLPGQYGLPALPDGLEDSVHSARDTSEDAR